MVAKINSDTKHMQKNYNLSVDVLRILAILAVILIHTTVTMIQAMGHKIALIPFTFFLNQLAIFAVPLFFLISGFVLELNYQNLSYLTYFKKRAAKIIIPYIFWSIFYILAYPKTISIHSSFFYLLLTGKAAYQLYFIPSIIILYLFFPILHTYYNFLQKKWLLGTLIVLEVIVQIYDYYYGPFSIGNTLRVSVLSFVMFPIGMIAAHHEEKIQSFTKKHFILLSMLPLLLICLIFTQSWYQYTVLRNAQAIYSQYNPLIIPYTLSIAAIVFFLCSYIQKYRNIIMRLSKLSFFVFFIHVAIIYTFWGMFKPFFLQTESSFWVTVGFSLFFFMFVSCISFLIADLMHRIPKLSKITG